MSIRSRYWARALRSSTTPVRRSIWSANVDLPWSMWAMMQKFRMTAGSVLPGTGAALFEDTKGFRGDVEDGRQSSHAGACGTKAHSGLTGTPSDLLRVGHHGEGRRTTSTPCGGQGSARRKPEAKLDPPLVLEHATCGLDHTARTLVGVIAGDQHPLEAQVRGVGQHRAKHRGRVAAPQPARPDLVADVTADVAEELGESVPHADATEVVLAVDPPPGGVRDDA